MHIWWFRDGRAGHERQSRALIEALARHVETDVFESRPLGAAGLARALAGRCHPGRTAPDLILGAGHDTHWSLLAARRARGGRAVVVMRPSLPLPWFDLCIAPRHDGVGGRANVLETLGPMSPVRPAASREGPSLVLVGGPSRHFSWHGDRLLEQLGRVVRARPDEGWQLVGSRRTPDEFLRRAARALGEAVILRPVERTPAGWLDEHLPAARTCLVTPDSLSMIFDALTAGVPCALFDLPRTRPRTRVAGAVEGLLDDGRVGRAADLAGGGELPVIPPMTEADDAAAALLERWFR